MALFKRAVPVETTPPARPKFLALGDAERDWMAGHLEVVDEFGIDLDVARDVAWLYDYFRALPAEIPPTTHGDRIDPNVFIRILGTVFGTHLTRRTTLAWTIATDAAGSELVLHDPRGNWLVYPAAVIAQRWMAGEAGEFIPVMSADIVSRMNAR
jgi:hypothetical protein